VNAVNIVDSVLEVVLLFELKSNVVCGNNFDEGSVSAHGSDFEDDSEVIKC